MKYEYKQLDIKTYIDSLYEDGLQKSVFFTDDILVKKISKIGLFKFKGYVKALRDKLSHYSIDDTFSLYEYDRVLSLNIFHLVGTIEIKIKAYLIELAYQHTTNPFFYLLQESYKTEFKLASDSLYDWEVKPSNTKKELYPHYRDYYLNKYNYSDNVKEYLFDKDLLQINDKKNINYPPFHYFIESATLGTVINMLSKLQIRENDILKLVGRKFRVLQPQLFISYLLRVKELRNRCAHHGRVFNRNYRSVKAIGRYKFIRKGIYDHRLLDVYYTLYFLLEEENELQNSIDLENRFIKENFNHENEKMEAFILNCMRKR